MLDPETEDAAAVAVAALPAPLTLTTRSAPNSHAVGVTDKVDRLAFGNVTVEVYRPGGGGRPLLSAVAVGAGTVSIDGLHVGMSVVELFERFGQPALTTNAQVVFRVVPSTTSPYELSASRAGDLVTALRWSAYLD